jgi:curved DNA-binding protein CbpA
MPASNKDYYKMLQVDPSAEHDVIEAVYKRLARKYHPDVNPAPDATCRMQELNTAYGVLCRPHTRAQYDRTRSAHAASPDAKYAEERRKREAAEAAQQRAQEEAQAARRRAHQAQQQREAAEAAWHHAKEEADAAQRRDPKEPPRQEPAAAPSSPPAEAQRKPVPSYSATRLLFDAKVIEPLALHDVFEIWTPEATWRMTKADFYRVFPQVVASKSYRTARCYHYPPSPEKAEPFRVR